MGVSPAKLLIIVAVVAILFLPMLLRQARSIPVLLEQARAAFAGEESETPRHRPQAAEPVHQAPPPASFAERLGRVVGRLLQRLGLFRAG
jgi:Sec-independent protein translocase protein TatA